jgi:glycosyltransferase involved in cell wall biosynthesis
MRFKVVVPGRDCVPWLDNCLRSLAHQTDPAVDVCVIDDASGDERQWDITSSYAKRHGWLSIRRETHYGALRNQYEAAHLLAPQDDDVIVFLDADDRLASPDSLSRLRWWYDQYRPLMTYGSYECSPVDLLVTPAQEFPNHVVEKNDYRAFSGRDDPDAIWFNHLRTVTFRLFSELEPRRDLCFPDGRWFMACCDTAIIVPCLELAAGRHLFIPEILYTYTRNNPQSDCRTQQDEIARVHEYIFRTLARRQPIAEIVQPVTHKLNYLPGALP